jgi:hypothetical protein
MASQAEHRTQAERNEDFFGTFDISGAKFLDWAVTVLFYSALHYLRSLMSKHGYLNVSSYGDMDRAFERLAVLKRNPDIYVDYRGLKDDSWAARYNMWRPAPSEVVELRDNEFQRVRHFVIANL